MPSPFPGMDPWLENPARWPDAHHRLISSISDQLAVPLRPKYVPRVQERVYITDDRDPALRHIIPDVHVGQSGRYDTGSSIGSVSGSQTAVAEPIVRKTFFEEEVHEPFLEIVDPADNRVIAVIEVLSPTNKVRNSEGQRKYLQKRHDVMRSAAHLLEIDLLRDGERMVVEPGLPECDYLIHLSRKGTRPRGYLWPILLKQRLPVIPIPLRDGDEDVHLDLQAVLTTTYDRGSYDLVIDYSRDPIPPLSSSSAEWAKTILLKLSTQS